jgi:hypothetical protein
VVKAFELNTETVAFLFQVFEYRGEISHPEILAGHGWRKTAVSPAILDLVKSCLQCVVTFHKSGSSSFLSA